MKLINEKKSKKEIILSLAQNKTCEQIQATLNLIFLKISLFLSLIQPKKIVMISSWTLISKPLKNVGSGKSKIKDCYLVLKKLKRP